MSRANYDLTEVCKQYQTNGTETNKKRHEIFKEIREASAGNREVLSVVASIMGAMVEKGHPPMDCIGFALCQGMTIGILLEKERAERNRRLT